MNNEQQKMKMSQDALYNYLNEHDVKVIRIAELMGKSPAPIISCFKHHNNAHGYPRCFSIENIRQLNDALQVMARDLRGCVMTFDTEQKPNRIGRIYDPGLVEPMKRIGELLNLTSLVERILGWKKGKKMSVLTDSNSKAYGNISESDMIAINSELLAIAGVLGNVEVVPDENAFEGYSNPEQ